MIEHCVSFFNKKQKQLQYQCYLTDALKAIGDTLHAYFGGSYMQSRYIELALPEKKEKKTTPKEARKRLLGKFD